jgi:cardiolipin synthase
MSAVVLAVLGTALAAALVWLLAANSTSPERDVRHRPERLYGSETPQFRRALGALLGPPVVGGNRVRTLVNGDRIFAAMLDAVGRAECSVTFEQFIFRDEIAERFCRAFEAAAARGVRVHVLLDWVGARDADEEALRCLREAGVQLELYHPPEWRHLGRLNNRTHRKLMVVDGRLGYVGGACVGREWTGDAQDPGHWRDTHFEVEGPVVAQIQSVFVDNWIKSAGVVLHGERYFPPLGPVGDVDAQMFMSSPRGGAASMHLMMLLAITAAQRSITIENSYFVPDRMILESLIAARERGVRVRVVTPNRHTDAKIGRWAAHGLYAPLLRAGVEIHEYEPTMIHCKVMVVDGHWVSVGSANYDNRSFRLNDEANLNVFDRGFAAEQLALIERDVAKSSRTSPSRWRQRALPRRFLEWTALRLRSQL